MMDREIDDIVRIALELMMCAMVIGAVALCAIAGHNLYDAKQLKDGNTAHLHDIAELYYYNNKIVTGSDAIELMMTYTRDYTYTFNFYDASGVKYDSFIVSKAHEGRDYKEYWSEENIRNHLKDMEKFKFSANLQRYSGESGIAGVVFDYRGG